MALRAKAGIENTKWHQRRPDDLQATAIALFLAGYYEDASFAVFRAEEGKARNAVEEALRRTFVRQASSQMDAANLIRDVCRLTGRDVSHGNYGYLGSLHTAAYQTARTCGPAILESELSWHAGRDGMFRAAALVGVGQAYSEAGQIHAAGNAFDEAEALARSCSDREIREWFVQFPVTMDEAAETKGGVRFWDLVTPFAQAGEWFRAERAVENIVYKTSRLGGYQQLGRVSASVGRIEAAEAYLVRAYQLALELRQRYDSVLGDTLECAAKSGAVEIALPHAGELESVYYKNKLVCTLVETMSRSPGLVSPNRLAQMTRIAREIKKQTHTLSAHLVALLPQRTALTGRNSFLRHKKQSMHLKMRSSGKK